MVDAHCHLSKDYYSDLDLIVNNMDGIMIVSGCNMKTNMEVLELVAKYDKVYGTLGLHPTESDDFNDENLKFIEENLSNSKIVGVGEIGLDYYWEKDKKELQQEWFIKQINLANKYNLPIVIHIREAINDTYQILKNNSKTKKYLHCYSGSLEMAYEFIKLDTLLGVGGVVTFNNSDKLKHIVEKIDLANFLIETDSPYMAPVPLRGKTNEPSLVKYVALKIAEIKNIPVEEVIKITSDNAYEIFNLKEVI